jgi:hypothetical protein
MYDVYSLCEGLRISQFVYPRYIPRRAVTPQRPSRQLSNTHSFSAAPPQRFPRSISAATSVIRALSTCSTVPTITTTYI